jgi:methylenetetrahydrofolate reductase (NADPH)
MAKYMKGQCPRHPDPRRPDPAHEPGRCPGGKSKDELTKGQESRSTAWQAEGIQITIELIQQLRQIEGVSGVHIMAIEWEEAVKPIVEGAGLFPRPVVPLPEPQAA